MLGLSQTTVSRALNGYPEVSPGTRERVAAAAAAHNYRPSTRARSLATGRSMAIGHVIPLSAGEELVNPIFPEFLAGAGATYASEGYDITLSVIPESDEAGVYRDFGARRAVDGVIVHTPRVDDPRIALLHETGLPFVVHGRTMNTGQCYAHLDVRNRDAFRRGAAFLHDLGHRRIGLINGEETKAFAMRRRLGLEDTMRERGLERDPGLFHSGPMTEPLGFEAASRMLALDRPPTAFLTSSVILAIGVRRAAQARGLSLGREVSLLTFDDDLSYLRDSGSPPVFTCLRSSIRKAGADCARMLLDRIAQPDAPLSGTLWDADLIPGGSTGPAPEGTRHAP